MKESDNQTTATSISSNEHHPEIGIYINDEYCDGIEAYQICESGPVVFSFSNQIPLEATSPISSPSLPPEIRSPTIGNTKRFIYDLGPSSPVSCDDAMCPPIPTVCFSPSMERKTDEIKPIISESFSTDCSLQPLSQARRKSLDHHSSPIPSSVMFNETSNAIVLANSKDSDHYFTQWCTQCCTHALSEVNETCNNIIYDDENVSCADDVQGCIMACLGDCMDIDLTEKRLLLENNITTILSSSSSFKKKSNESHTPKKISIRNRASKRNAQARRLRRLRNEMSFVQSLKTKEQNFTWIQTTMSDDEDTVDTFDETVSTGAGTIFSTSTALATIDNDDGSRSLLSCPITSSLTSPTSSSFTTTTPQNNDLYYDSDPGEIKLRILTQTNSRRAVIEKLDLLNETKIWSNPIKGHEIESMQMITNGKMNLVWHPTCANTVYSPICIQAWIESGSRLNHNSQFIQPKFMWKRGYYESKHRSFHQKNNQNYTIDLLDICRVLPTTSIDRSMHPYAKKSVSFTIETHADLYLFECKSGRERDDIVHNLKVVVARLASQLIVGDSNVYREFFSGVGSVPGEAVDWANIASGSG